MQTNEADREVDGFTLGENGRLANAKISMVHENSPDAARMDGTERTERKSSVQATSHQLSYFVNGFIRMFLYAGQISLFSIILRTHRAEYMLDNMLARANSVCLLALSRFDRRVLALLLVRVDCAALCGVVLAEQRKQRTSGRFPNKLCSRRQLQAEKG